MSRACGYLAALYGQFGGPLAAQPTAGEVFQYPSAAAATVQEAGESTPADIPATENLPALSLDEVIQLALANNLGLLSRNLDPLDARDDVEANEAAFDPRLSASLSRSERESAAAGSALDSADRPFSAGRGYDVSVRKRIPSGATLGMSSGLSRSFSNNNFARNPDYASDLGFSISQPLLRGAGTAVNLAPIIRARIGAQASELDLRATYSQTITDVENAYWSLAFAQARLETLRNNADISRRLLEENRERKRLGLVTGLEVLQAEAELVSRQEDILVAEADLADQRDSLLRICGILDRPGEQLFRVAGLPRELAQPPPLREVIIDAISNDPALWAQQTRIESAKVGARQADNAVKPDLSVNMNLNLLGRDTDGLEAYRTAYDTEGYNWNIGVTLSVPWGMRAEKARARQADRDVSRAEYRLEELRQGKVEEARQRWRTFSTALKRLEFSSTTLRLREESFEQERGRYAAGSVAYRRVLEAQRDLDNARLANLRTIFETIQAQVNLAEVTGNTFQRHNYRWETVYPEAGNREAADSTDMPEAASTND